MYLITKGVYMQVSSTTNLGFGHMEVSRRVLYDMDKDRNRLYNMFNESSNNNPNKFLY